MKYKLYFEKSVGNYLMTGWTIFNNECNLPNIKKNYPNLKITNIIKL